MEFAKLIRDVPDFPKKGIVFKDITPLLGDPKGLRASIDALAERLSGLKIDRIAGIESRGFLFGMPLADRLGLGFIPIRKPNKLPYRTRSHEYDLEYGKDTIEVHEDALEKGDKVVVVDDLLATGGTMGAACSLLEAIGGEVVACLVLVELGFLPGREKLGGRRVESLIRYD
jgi:adenine phosphoribosyltransferase